MKTLARETRTQPSSAKSAHGNLRYALSTPVALTPYTGVNANLVQRKIGCACGGGCPRCEEESTLQPKLKVSQPDDHYEQEADRVAEQVMRAGDDAAHQETRADKSVPILQRRAAGQADPDAAPSIVRDVLNSAGQPLDDATRQFMEPRLGRDLSQVRVHTDARAAESARAVNALAYTVGHNVVFAAGHYAPRSSTGQRLLAHELTHVVQQNGDRLQRAKPQERGAAQQDVVVRQNISYSGPRIARWASDQCIAPHAGCLARSSVANWCIFVWFMINYPRNIWAEFGFGSPQTAISCADIVRYDPSSGRGTPTVEVYEIKSEDQAAADQALLETRRATGQTFCGGPGPNGAPPNTQWVLGERFPGPILIPCRAAAVERLVESGTPGWENIAHYLYVYQRSGLPGKILYRPYRPGQRVAVADQRNPSPAQLRLYNNNLGARRATAAAAPGGAEAAPPMEVVDDISQSPGWAVVGAGLAASAMWQSARATAMAGARRAALGPLAPAYAAAVAVAAAIVLARGGSVALAGTRGSQDPFSALFQALRHRGVPVSADLEAAIRSDPELRSAVEQGVRAGNGNALAEVCNRRLHSMPAGGTGHVPPELAQFLQAASQNPPPGVNAGALQTAAGPGPTQPPGAGTPSNATGQRPPAGGTRTPQAGGARAQARAGSVLGREDGELLEEILRERILNGYTQTGVSWLRTEESPEGIVEGIYYRRIGGVYCGALVRLRIQRAAGRVSSVTITYSTEFIDQNGEVHAPPGTDLGPHAPSDVLESGSGQ